MSFIHYLFLGHFEREGGHIRFAKGAGDGIWRPMVQRPIDPDAIKSALRETKGIAGDNLSFSETWTMGVDDDYLICDKYTGNPSEIDFVARLAKQTGCEIYDVGAHCEIAIGEWLAAKSAMAPF